MNVRDASREERELLAEGKIETTPFTYFRPAKVYELAQTDCPPEKYPEICRRGFTSDVHKELFERLKVVAELGGFTVNVQTLAGSTLSGYCDPTQKAIVLNSNLDDSERLTTLNHEWAHGMLHLSSKLPTEIQEFEAEAASLILQQRFGLPVSDEMRAYVAYYMSKCQKIPSFDMEKSLQRVVKHANFVSDTMGLQELRTSIQQNTMMQEHSINQINQAFMQDI